MSKLNKEVWKEKLAILKTPGAVLKPVSKQLPKPVSQKSMKKSPRGR